MTKYPVNLAQLIGHRTLDYMCIDSDFGHPTYLFSMVKFWATKLLDKKNKIGWLN
jgi:hypothetical protein